MTTRAVAAFMAVWVALVLGEPGVVHHHCPMHDAAAPSAATAMTHAGHSADRAPEPTGKGHLCTCVGACAATGSAATLSAAPCVASAAVAYVDAAYRPDRESAPLPHRAFALPFANGPPATPVA